MSLYTALLHYGPSGLVDRLREVADWTGVSEAEFDPIAFMRDAVEGKLVKEVRILVRSNTYSTLDPGYEAKMLLRSSAIEVFIGLQEGSLIAEGVVKGRAERSLIPPEKWIHANNLDLLSDSAIFPDGSQFVAVHIYRNPIPRDFKGKGPGRPSNMTKPYLKKLQELEAVGVPMPATVKTARRLISALDGDPEIKEVPTERAIIKAIQRYRKVKMADDSI